MLYLAGPLPSPARWLVRAAAIAVIVLVALARVILHAHWPSDALAGIALGTAFASVAALAADPRRATRARSSRTRVLRRFGRWPRRAQIDDVLRCATCGIGEAVSACGS